MNDITDEAPEKACPKKFTKKHGERINITDFQSSSSSYICSSILHLLSSHT